MKTLALCALVAVLCAHLTPARSAERLIDIIDRASSALLGITIVWLWRTKDQPRNPFK